MRNSALPLCLLALLACRTAEVEEEEPPTPPEPVAEGPAEQEVEDALQDEFERMTLAQQKRAFLVEQHIVNAQRLRDELRLEEAAREATLALELDAANREARALLTEIEALLGRPPGEIRTVVERLGEFYDLRAQQMREDARENVQRAKLMLARGQYDSAITELELALDVVRFAPIAVDWQGIDDEAVNMLERALAERETVLAQQRDRAQQEALEAIRERERAERQREAARVTNLLDQAVSAFKAQQYDEAMDLADRVLRLDPRNEKAQDIRDTAFRAGRNLVADLTLQRKQEQYLRWQEEMDELLIPYTDVVTLPDEDFWRDITELRSRRRGLVDVDTVGEGERALRRELRTTTIPGFQFQDEESLTAVMSALSAISGLPIVVDPRAEEAAFDEGVVFDFSITNPITVEKMLNLITDMAGPEVTWTIRHEVVLVTTPERARGDLAIQNHPIEDLIFGLTDFLGPRIDRLRLLHEIEDDEGGGIFGGIGEQVRILDPDDLGTLVQENVAVDTWFLEGVSITVEGGNMIVVNTLDVQRQVRDFLEDLRRFSSSLVTIESKFLTIADNFIQEIGVDFRGLDNPGTPFTDLDDVTSGLEDMASLGLDNFGPGLGAGGAATPPSAGFFYDDGLDGDFKGHISNIFGNPLGETLTTIGGLTAQWTLLEDLQISAILRMVEKHENIELLNDQILSVYNTQRAYVTVINQRAFVQDFDVEVAQFEAIADPQINVLEEGIVLDVRPTISHDRRYITLELQPTVAEVVALTNFSTTLGGQTQAVTFQLPELRVQSAFSTVQVPDGGSVLIGGLSKIRNIERRASVPWIGNIPIVGFFFKEEGYSDERSSLMIMVRAWITDVRDELARLDDR